MTVTTQATNKSNGQEIVGNQETTTVSRLRRLMMIVLFGAALGVTLGVYFLTRSSEEEIFQKQFQGGATRIINSFGDIIDEKFAAIASLGMQWSLYEVNSDTESWPNVKLDDWQSRASAAREQSGAAFVRLTSLVDPSERTSYEAYTASLYNEVLDEAQAYLDSVGGTFDILDVVNIPDDGRENVMPESNDGQRRVLQDLEEQELQESEAYAPNITFLRGTFGNHIYEFDAAFNVKYSPDDENLMPLWLESPYFGRDFHNWNIDAYPEFSKYMRHTRDTKRMTIGGLDTAPPGWWNHPDVSTSYFSSIMTIKNGGVPTYYDGTPMSTIFVPVFGAERHGDNTYTNIIHTDYRESKVEALMFATFQWSNYFERVLPPNFAGLHIVLENGCDEVFTLSVVGDTSSYVGIGDLHDPKYDDLVVTTSFALDNRTALGLELNTDICPVQIRVYPTSDLEDQYITRLPVAVTLAVAVVFFFTTLLFWVFNVSVERRQHLVLDRAVKSTAIVSSLFPDTVRDRLLDPQLLSGKNKIMSFLNEGNDGPKGKEEMDRLMEQPIADLFPHCTVFFADIAGFTAWSSTRDPAQVFVLLQTVYQSFDRLAAQYGVFKVETIGDSYVAVTGLPQPNDQHAVDMARFAHACLQEFAAQTHGLEKTLGPDTAALGIRFGLHSGPVTAGVLRGERSRFQLFGDTVNTAARMESTSDSNRIQMTTATADLLNAAGHSDWVEHRSDTVTAKGKGVLSTYWLNVTSSETSSDTSGSEVFSAKHEQLVTWMVGLFTKHIVKIIARQDKKKRGRCSPSELVYNVPDGKTSLEEVADTITLPEYDSKAVKRAQQNGTSPLSERVEAQLRSVVEIISSTYHDENDFHNFAHACHVTMAVDKFLSRIETPDVEGNACTNSTGLANLIHDFSYGIVSDPITVLAILFSAFVHDADHRGVSNVQMQKEEPNMAALYKNQSIAEQHSLDLAWAVLMDEEHQALRSALFVSREELMRFRQVTVQVVLATDIFDKDLNDRRKARWAQAFSANQHTNKDLRTTIVIEHIIQASDVSHTMQHWHVYRKWNRNLFREMHSAYQLGRMGADPSTFWYKGELSFFDNYVIPLAKKLKDCGVFGVSSDECLNYALQNRAEWEAKGQEALEEMLRELANESRRRLLPRA